MSLHQIKKLLPKLTSTARSTLHKGQHGKVGVVGGCFEYTGAPYYSAISSLKQGADLAHIFCSASAAVPIKSYSPEIIVHPVMPDPVVEEKYRTQSVRHAVDSVVKVFPRLSSLVIGPGLGRDELMLDAAAEIISAARDHNLPLVIDADGIFLLSKHPHLVRGNTKVVLTPNVGELKRLWSALFDISQPFPGSRASAPYDDSFDGDSHTNVQKHTPKHGRMVFPGKDSSAGHISAAYLIAKELGHVTVLQKGPEDVISNGHIEVVCSSTGSPRRCGGQGDILSGCVATFLSWADMKLLKENKPAVVLNDTTTTTKDQLKYSKDVSEVTAAWGAALVVRRSAFVAFSKHQRSTTTPDIINYLGEAISYLFPIQNEGQKKSSKMEKNLTVNDLDDTEATEPVHDVCDRVPCMSTASVLYEHERNVEILTQKVERMFSL